jgi:hypothetical protein
MLAVGLLIAAVLILYYEYQEAEKRAKIESAKYKAELEAEGTKARAEMAAEGAKLAEDTVTARLQNRSTWRSLTALRLSSVLASMSFSETIAKRLHTSNS